MPSFGAQLSPKEKAALHRIASGTCELKKFSLDNVRRLTALGLVTTVAGGLYATEAGLTQNQSLALKHANRQRLKQRILPP